jgi:hypothetical protein
VHHAFGTVLWVVCAIGFIVAILALVVARKTWEDYGKGLLMDSDLPQGPAPGSAAAIHERDTEIREMLKAKNERRLRRGEQPIDVEEELARLTAPKIDAGLRAEIRDLVVARNHRRTRAGKPPLDVEAEIEREIEKLSNL